MALVIRRKRKVNECDGGGACGGAFNGAGSVTGMGNPVMPSMAATTAAEQSSPDCMGSGDLPTTLGGMNTQAGPVKKKKLRIRKSRH